MSEEEKKDYKDMSMPEQAAATLSSAAKDTFNSVKGAVETQQSIANNANASGAQAVAATVLGGAEAALSVFGAVTGAPTKITEELMLPVLQKMSFLKGLACLPVLKQTDPVMGIDVHNVIIPPSPVVPMPHPYIGMLFRPKDFVSCALLSVLPTPPEAEPPAADASAAEISEFLAAQALNLAHTAATMAIGQMGASVKIGFFPRVVAGTPTKNFPHIPMGTGFSPPFVLVQKNVGHSFLGSLTVNADGDPLSGAVAHLHNDCWDAGAVNLHGEEGIPSLMRFYLPSGISTSIPSAKITLVNPVPTPLNLMQSARLLKAGLGKLGRKLGRKGFQKILDNINPKSKLGKKLGGCPGMTALSQKYGTSKSHPVDVSEGHFFTSNIDFSFAGVIPFEFKREYFSYNDRQGCLGTGWSHPYDMALALDFDTGIAALRLNDGRTTGFRIPAKGASDFNRREKLWLHRGEDGVFHVADTEGLLYRFTEKEYQNLFTGAECFLLQSVSNRNGYSIRFAYDRDGILNKITDAAGRIFTVESDGKGHISKITAPSADNSDESFVVSSYEYDAHGRLISQTDALGATMRFEYDGSLMTREVWRNGLNWVMRYKGRGAEAKCIEITGDRDLFHYLFDYVTPDCTLVTDSLGHKTTYYHRGGVVTKRIDPSGGESVFRYNEYTELEWTVDPLGNGEGQTQDELGNLVTKTAADGGFTFLQYDNYDFPCLPTSATDAAGGKWKWEYDGQGNLAKRIDPTGAQTVFGYADGLLAVITGAQGETTKLEYDRESNLVKTVSPDGGINRWRYDRLGQCLKHENAKGGVTEYEYDLLGQVVKVKEPDGNVRELAYDVEGNVVRAQDKDRDVRFGYRGVNKLSARMERGAMLRFLYDTEDQLRTVVNEANEEYTFQLDAQGNVVEEKGFDGLERHYERDLAGQVVRVTRPDKRETAYEYDSCGRVTKVVYNPDGNERERREETYEYRRDGALLKATNSDAEVILERDVLGRVVKETCNGETVESKYDLSGNRIHITSSFGADIRADYNIMGDVVSLANGGWQTQYMRDLFGLESGRTLAGGVFSRTERDSLGRVVSNKLERNNRYLSEKSYLWGANDKLLKTVTDGKVKNFEYDGWGNLSKTIFEDGKVEHRAPDKTGNLFERLDRMDRKYASGGQLVKTENWEYKYDKEGNLVRKKDKHGATWRYEWNAAGMLASVKRPDAQEVTFKYDALGRRIEKRFGRRVTTWQWDGNVPLHEKTGTITPDYSEERGHFDDIRTQPVITWVFEEGTFVPAAKITEKEKFSIVTNYLGTPEAMYREDGEKVWTCELNSYGKVRNFQGESKIMCPFRYQGQYEDAETGLYYNRFRYFDPDSGSYLNQDPIRLAGNNPTLYGYVKDSNSWIDVLGLDFSDLSKRKAGGTGSKYDAVNGQGIYVLRDPISGDIKYVGRGDVHARAVAHANTPGKSHLVQEIIHDNNLTKAEAKHIEQRLIDKMGGAKSQNASTPLLNEIRSYSPDNPNAGKYDIAGKSQGHADAIWQQTIIKLGI